MMDKVILDEAIGAKLSAVDEIELCDPSGRHVGHFLSEKFFRRLLFDWANAQITDGELERRRRQPGGHSLPEVWSRLKGA